jgi:hypothetical protein
MMRAGMVPPTVSGWTRGALGGPVPRQIPPVGFDPRSWRPRIPGKYADMSPPSREQPQRSSARPGELRDIDAQKIDADRRRSKAVRS